MTRPCTMIRSPIASPLPCTVRSASVSRTSPAPNFGPVSSDIPAGGITSALPGERSTVER